MTLSSQVRPARAEGSAQTATDSLLAETVLSVEVLAGDTTLNIAARNDQDAQPLVATVTEPGGTSTDFTLTPGNGLLTDQALPPSITNPLRVPATPGTYQVQFNKQVLPYDISVTDNATDPVDPTAVPALGGRVYSTDWRMLSTLNMASPDIELFVRAPVLDAEYIWDLQLSGLAGGYMCLVANDLGLPGPLARSSQSDATLEAQTGLTLDRLDYCDDLAQYSIFLNPPNSRKPQPGVPELEFIGIAGCGAVLEGAGGTFEFTANMPSTYEIVIDTDRDGDFDPTSDDAVIQGAAAAGTNFVEWDGTDGTGASVAASADAYGARLYLRLGEFHFTAIDVETLNPGITVNLVDPDDLTETAALMYWDDRAIAAGGEPNPELTVPDGSLSPHAWGNFAGDTGVGNNAYIDTWVFGQEVTADVQVTIDDAAADQDGDGLINGRECEIGSFFDNPDTDNDGVPDGEEAPASGPIPDTDSDAQGDIFDADDDGDGVPTADENPDPNGDSSAADAQNTDGDATPDYLDPDDDGDGVPTLEEDPNGDNDVSNDDTDSDNTPNYLDDDDDGDGIPTLDEDVNGDADPSNDDTDSDNTPNYLDADDDGDGIPTEEEIADAGDNDDLDGDGDVNWLDPDSDGDGISDMAEAAGDGDLNNDGIPDYLDPLNSPLDSDGDGIPDDAECSDITTCEDTDGDGTPNHLDADDDGDGIPTMAERPNGEDVDSDGDGTPDHLDADDDGDGVPTAVERPNDEDVDTDGDATPDHLDADDDGDGIPTADERPNDEDVDTDGDGTPDYLDPDDDNDSVPTTDERPGGESVDSDDDGTPDYLDIDDDGDGLDTIDERPGNESIDSDGDGAPDYLDVDDLEPFDAGAADGGTAPADLDAGTAPVDLDGGSAPVDLDDGAAPADVDAGAPPSPIEAGTGEDMADAGAAPEPESQAGVDAAAEEEAEPASPTGTLEGGGCSCRTLGAGPDGPSGAWLTAPLLLGLALLRRRRRAPGTSRRTMWLLGWIALCILPRGASAQSAGIALDRYEPSERGSDWFAGESLDLRGNGRWALGAVGDFGYKPLVVYDDNGDELKAIVSDQLFIHAGAAVIAWDRVRFALNVPILVHQNGSSVAVNGASFSAKDGAGLGDVRLGVDLRLLGEYGDAATLALGVQGHLPTGSRDNYTSDGKVRITPRLLVAGDLAAFAYSARVGAAIRTQNENFGNDPFGTDLQFVTTAGLRFADRALLIGPELWGSTVISDSGDGFFKRRTTPIEGVLGAHLFSGDWRIGLGAGPGLSRGIGSPQVRVLASIEWFPELAEPLPPKADTDGDGILDDVDACPTLAGEPSEDPSEHGCPPPPPPADNDGDGILNQDDACIDEPGDANDDPKLNGCPKRDRDGDGILDEDDACVDEPGKPNEDAKKNGCPERDSDDDGILDDKDACPQQAGPPNADPKLHGCPRVEVQRERIVILDRVEFDTGKATLRGESDGILQAVLEVLNEHPEITLVRVEGHTDNRGTAAFNTRLSRDRAAAVVQWLVARGIDSSRLTSQGFGPSRPVDDNATEQGRQANRRVEFHIVSQKPPTE